VIVQDVSLFALSKDAGQAGTVVIALQGLVLLVAVALVVLGKRSVARGWSA